MTKKFLIIPLVIAYSFSVYIFASLYLADVHYSMSQKLLSKGEVVKGLEEIDKAISLNSLEPAYHRGRAKIFVYATIGQDTDSTKNLKTLASQELKASYNLNPNNLATIRNNTPIHYLLALKNIEQPVSAQNLDPVFLSEAKNYFEQTKKLYPNDVGVYTLIAGYEKKLGLTKEFNESIARIKELRPDLLDWQEDLK